MCFPLFLTTLDTEYWKPQGQTYIQYPGVRVTDFTLMSDISQLRSWIEATNTLCRFRLLN